MNKPSWATFSASTGELSGTPNAAGSFANIVISVTDGTQTSSLDAFSISVSVPNPTNHPPTISGQPPTSVRVGSTYSFTPTASDPDGDNLTFSVSNRPAWLTFQRRDRNADGHPECGQRRHLFRNHHQRERRNGFRLAARLLDPGHGGADDLRHAADFCGGRHRLFLPAQDQRGGRHQADLLHPEPARVGRLQHRHRAAGRHTLEQPGRHLLGHRHQRDGRHPNELAAGLLDQSDGGTDHLRQPAHPGHRRNGLQLQAERRMPPPARRLRSRSRTSPRGPPSAPRPVPSRVRPTASQVGTSSNIVISVTDGTQTSSLPAFSVKVVSAGTLTISGTPAASVNVGLRLQLRPDGRQPQRGHAHFQHPEQAVVGEPSIRPTVSSPVHPPPPAPAPTRAS